MPKAPISPSSPIDVKPYLVTSTPQKPKPKASPKPPKPIKVTGAKGRPWTDEEKLKLFELAVKHGAGIRTFEGKIEGRTGKHCYLTWHNTLEPAIKRSLGQQAK